MSELEKVTLNNYRRGDAHPGLTFGPVIADGIAPVAAVASARMQFRDEDDALGFELNDTPGADEGEITIVDADTWDFAILKQVFGLRITNGEKKQKYYWDFEVTDINGDPLTIAEGVMVVTADITHD
jgi:hypothetical protein